MWMTLRTNPAELEAFYQQSKRSYFLTSNEDTLKTILLKMKENL